MKRAIDEGSASALRCGYGVVRAPRVEEMHRRRNRKRHGLLVPRHVAHVAGLPPNVRTETVTVDGQGCKPGGRRAVILGGHSGRDGPPQTSTDWASPEAANTQCGVLAVHTGHVG